MSPKNKTRIIIVDDHPVLRQGLKLIIEDEDDLMIWEIPENAKRCH